MGKVLAMVFVVLFAFAACQKVDTKPSDANSKPPPAKEDVSEIQASVSGTVGTISINTASGPVLYSIEIAETDEQRRVGLMNRESIPENYGMWFVFPQMVQEKFWMKDTQIPLDLIYVDDTNKIVHIIENTVPESTELLNSPVPFKYVLEINSGQVARRGIKVGETVEKRIGPK